MTIRRLFNRCGDTTASTGTGVLNLANSPPTQFGPMVAPQAVATSGDTGDYVIVGTDAGGAAYEAGIGTLTSGSPWTLTRDTVLDTDDQGTAKLSFTAISYIFFQPHASALEAAMLPYVATQTPTAGNITFTWNRTMPVNLGSLTGLRDAVVTAPPFIGARARIQVTAKAPATLGRELRLIGDTGIDLGGAGAAIEWSRLLINREHVTLVARSLTEVDIEVDGRLPQYAKVGITTAHPALATDNTFETIDFSGYGAEQVDIGDIYDTANDYIAPRRAGVYRCFGNAGAEAINSGLAEASVQTVSGLIIAGSSTSGVVGRWLAGPHTSGYHDLALAALGGTGGQIVLSMLTKDDGGTATFNPWDNGRGTYVNLAVQEVL